MGRYQRQIILSQFGQEGQDKLAAAKILVVGAGGLGCPVLMYLAAAGVGHLGIVDQDVVSLANLQRQVLYKTEDVGLPKVERAKQYLLEMNPEVNVTSYFTYLTTENALEIVHEYDIIVDATDNFPSRYLLNDACVILDKVLVYGAVSNFEGQVAVFNVTLDNGAKSANYRDIFPNPPMENEIGNCAEIGVLGVLPGTIGCIQASEVIKLIAGVGKPLVNQLQTVNLLTNHWQTFTIQASAETRSLIPKDIISFRNKDYSLICSPLQKMEIDLADFQSYFDKDDVVIIDLRESFEKPEIDYFHHQKYPLSEWEKAVPSFQESTIILFCQSGKRSLDAAKKMSEFSKDKTILSLKGGILHWQNKYQNITNE
jgi:molybdopterin/thiamine biosynthesis adenylyltransferase/rhodanese-related sulfurtransferase